MGLHSSRGQAMVRTLYPPVNEVYHGDQGGRRFAEERKLTDEIAIAIISLRWCCDIAATSLRTTTIRGVECCRSIPVASESTQPDFVDPTQWSSPSQAHQALHFSVTLCYGAYPNPDMHLMVRFAAHQTGQNSNTAIWVYSNRRPPAFIHFSSSHNQSHYYTVTADRQVDRPLTNNHSSTTTSQQPLLASHYNAVTDLHSPWSR